MIWDALTPMWRHCKCGLFSSHGVQENGTPTSSLKWRHNGRAGQIHHSSTRAYLVSMDKKSQFCNNFIPGFNFAICGFLLMYVRLYVYKSTRSNHIYYVTGNFAVKQSMCHILESEFERFLVHTYLMWHILPYGCILCIHLCCYIYFWVYVCGCFMYIRRIALFELMFFVDWTVFK